GLPMCHLQGASEKTLTKLKLLGASADNDPMAGEEVLNRLRLGYHVPLRYSSIRPDLPKLLDEILELELDVFDQLTYTTDGSSPVFMEKGVINLCIDIAIKKGIPLDRKSTRLNSSHVKISYAVFCLKKKTKDRVDINCR